jgi:hypothetical protein
MASDARKFAHGDIRFTLLIAIAASFWPSRPLIAAQNADVAGSLIVENVINAKTTNTNFGLGDRIEIAISGPSVAIQRAASDPKGIILIFDDTALHGLCTNAIVFGSPQFRTSYVASATRVIETNGVAPKQTFTTNEVMVTNAVVATNLSMRLQFKLHRTEANKAEWLGFLGSPRTVMRPIQVSLGMNSDNSIITLTSNRFPATLIVLPHSPFFPKGSQNWQIARGAAIAAVVLIIFWSFVRQRSPKACLTNSVSWFGWIALLIALYCCAGPIVCWSVFFVLFVVSFFYLARKTEMLRDSGPEPPPGKMRPYSLARTQMAIWFFLIVLSFVLIWLMTSALDSVTGTVLALMGIGAGTALGAEAQFTNKLDKQTADLENKPPTTDTDKVNLDILRSYLLDPSKLQEEKEILERRQLTELKNQLEEKKQKGTLTDEENGRLESILKKLVLLPKPSAEQLERDTGFKFPVDIDARINDLRRLLGCRPVSKGFFNDVLSDDIGISFHRFQMFIWTIVLAVIFLSSTYSQLAMPEFNGTLLALMGISSGTYLGFMIVEPPPKLRS